MCDWTNELTLKFLESYRNEPVIWNPMHSFHKDKKKINDAWVRLSGRLECSVTELKKKKDSLMATFRGHLRKKKASIKSGAGTIDIYKPIWFAYECMESFLAPTYNFQTTTNSQDTAFVTDKQSQHMEIGSVYDEQNPSVIAADKKVNITENITITTDNTSTVVHEQTNSIPSRSKPTVLRHGNPLELLEAENPMKEVFNLLKNVIAKRSSEKADDDDEYDLFGKMLAKKIRKLPEHERVVFMYEIDGLYLNKLRNVNSSGV